MTVQSQWKPQGQSHVQPSVSARRELCPVVHKTAQIVRRPESLRLLGGQENGSIDTSVEDLADHRQCRLRINRDMYDQNFWMLMWTACRRKGQFGVMQLFWFRLALHNGYRQGLGHCEGVLGLLQRTTACTCYFVSSFSLLRHFCSINVSFYDHLTFMYSAVGYCGRII